MYLSVVCTNTRFDVQIQIWITNNIHKNSSIVIVKLLYIHDLVFLIDYSFTVERFVHNLHEDTSYPMYTYCDRSFRKNYECIYLSFFFNDIVFWRNFFLRWYSRHFEFKVVFLYSFGYDKMLDNTNSEKIIRTFNIIFLP